MILTKMLRGVSLGTTLREPFGKSAETMLSNRLVGMEKKKRGGEWGMIQSNLLPDTCAKFVLGVSACPGVSGTDLCVTVLLSHLILMM